MVKKIVISGIVGGVVLFLWSAISWMVLPYHMETIHSFKDSKVVAETVKDNAMVSSGMYFTPMMHKDGSNMSTEEARQPMVFAAVTVEGMNKSMQTAMGYGLATQILAAFLVAYMLMQLPSTAGYIRRVWFVVVFGLSAGVVTDIPYWNWFGFDCNYTLVQMADLIVGWFFAGLVLGLICRKTE